MHHRTFWLRPAAAWASGLLFAAAVQAAAPAGVGPNPQLPAPSRQLIPTVHIAPAHGWPAGAMPTAPRGFGVTAFASGLDHPRWIYVLPNGDVLVAQTNAPPKPADAAQGGLKSMVMGAVMKRAGAGMQSPNQILLLRDADGDGVAEHRQVLLQGLNSPFGMAWHAGVLYIATADAVLKTTYQPGQDRTGPLEKITDLPAGINHHWTKNLLLSPDGAKLFVTVGSNSNAGENGLAAEEGRAAIWQLDLATGRKRLFASGLRNPNGLAWEPVTGALWTVVNERDALGDDLVPDYLTSVKEGAFYGWPWSYWGQHVDERVKPPNPQQVARAIPPDYGLGSHVAPLGLAFANATLPEPYQSGAFIGEHGSWNRKPRAGYKVVFVAFEGGQPKGLPIDFLTGFVSEDGKAYGRPVGVALDGKGGLLVADDVGNAVWRVGVKRNGAKR